ncbi:MAG: (2Fe-2S)-binding protein [Saprospiraceae bacterium]|nr:(2Fe-2S)-binding protein [Saprospiraceae bacterium]
MIKTSFSLNGEIVHVETAADAMLLWTLRDELQQTGTKYGCGIALCGACTVHLDGVPIRACITPVSSVGGRSVTTIEGLSKDGQHPLQKAWIEEQVPQCGYCQSGQIMQAAALLQNNTGPSREEIIAHMNGILCRCGTYYRVFNAIERASKEG